MDEQEPEAELSSPIIGPEEQYRGRPDRLDRALLAGAVAVLVVIIVGIAFVAQYVASPW